MEIKPLARGIGALGRGVLGGGEATGGLTYQPSLLYDFTLGTMNFTLPTSFTRLLGRTINDFEVKSRVILASEVPFYGLRRVRNFYSNPENPAAWANVNGGDGVAPVITANYGSVAAPDGTFTATRLQVQVTDASNNANTSYTQMTVSANPTLQATTVWMRTTDGSTKTIYYRTGAIPATYTLDGTWRRYRSQDLAAAANHHIGVRGGSYTTGYGVATQCSSGAVDILIWRPQLEDVTGQSNQNPSEYVSVGADKLNWIIETENFASASWSKVVGGTGVAATATNNAGAAPDGSNTAAQVNLNRGAGNLLADHAFIGQTPTLAPTSGTWTSGFWVKGTAGEQVAFRGTAGSAYTVVTFTGVWQFVEAAETYFSGNFNIANRGTVTTTNNVTFLIWHPQFIFGSTLTGRSYFPVGNVYPFHGAGVDGVKYFPYENGNTVTSNVVTEAQGEPIPPSGRANARLPGLAASYFRAAGPNVSGDITVETDTILDDWTPIAEGTIYSKWTTAGNQRGWSLNVIGTGVIRFYVSLDGTAVTTYSSTVPSGVTDLTGKQIKVERESATGTARIFLRDGESAPWVQLGADIAGPAGAIFETSANYEVGSNSSGASPLPATTRRACTYSGIGASKTLVNCFNPQDGFTENRLVNSKMEGGAAAPTSWVQSSGTGTSAVDSTLASGDVVYAQSAAAQRPYFAQGFVSEAGVNYRSMMYLHENPNSLVLNQLMVYVTLPAGASLLYSDGTAAGATVAPIGWIWVDLIGATAAGTPALRTGIGVNSNATGSIKFSRPQVRRLSISPTTPLDNTYIQSALAAGRTGWDSAATGEQWSANGGAMVNRQVPGYMPDVATTNRVIQSGNFGTTWATLGTPTRVAAAKSCGDIVLDLIGDDDPAAVEGYQQAAAQGFVFVGDGVKSRSFYFAQASSTSSGFRITDLTAGANRLLGVVTWSNGLPVVTMTTGTLLGVDYVGNGIFRVRVATTAVTAANNNFLQCYPATDAAIAVGNTGTVYWGAEQAEDATTCSSYQPTTTGAVTRNADQMLIGTLGSWFNPAEGSIAVAIVQSPNPVGGSFWEFNDSTGNERLGGLQSTSNFRTFANDGGVGQVDFNVAGLTANMAGKAAAAYKVNDFATYVNGAASGTDVVATLPTVTNLQIGYTSVAPTVSQPQAVIQSLAYYPQRIPNPFLSLFSSL